VHSSTRFRRLLAGAAALTMVLAACGSDDDTSSGSAAPTTSAAAATSSAASATTTGAADTTDDTTDDTTADTTADTSAPESTDGSSATTEASDPSSTDDAPETSAAGDDPLGTPTAASGAPVKIGLITESGGEAIGSQSALTEEGAQIAVDYVNEYRGGLGGHPIDLFICGNKASPAGASDCANQMVEQGVAAVVWPFTGFGPQEVPIITGAGIPVLAVSGSSAEELTTPNVFVLTGGYPGTLGAYAQHAKDNGVKKFAMIVTDVPSATQAAQTLGGIVFGNAKVDYSAIPVAPGTPDLTSQLQAAVSDGADALGVTGDVTFCTSFFQAYQTLGLTIPKYIISPCIDPTVIESLGDVLDGSILATTAGRGPDTDTYAAMVAKYGSDDIDPDPNISAGVSAGVGAVMNLWNVMDGASGDVTSAAVIAQVKAAKDVPIWGSGGLTFTCDGSAVSILPNVCSAKFQIGTVDSSGKAQDLAPVDASALYVTG